MVPLIFRPTHIANDSVNSVSLNTDPNISSPRMMVAAYVGLNPNVTALTARDTTLMPDVAGLFPLIALVFTPIAEFRYIFLYIYIYIYI